MSKVIELVDNEWLQDSNPEVSNFKDGALFSIPDCFFQSQIQRPERRQEQRGRQGSVRKDCGHSRRLPAALPWGSSFEVG